MDFSSLMLKDGEPVTICPIGDIQFTGRDADVAEDDLREHIAYCLSLPNPRFIGLGDYVDHFSPSQRASLTMPTVRQSTLQFLHDKLRELTETLYDTVLAPTRGKWLGMVVGHHCWNMGNETTDSYLAKLLDTRVLGDANPQSVARGVGILGLKWPRVLRRVYFHHGCGSSVYPWGPVTKLVHTARHWQADIFMIGHQSKTAIARYDEIHPEFPDDADPYLSHNPRWLVGTGSWTKAYRLGEVTYVEEAALAPAGIGAPIVRAEFTSAERLRIEVGSVGTVDVL